MVDAEVRDVPQLRLRAQRVELGVAVAAEPLIARHDGWRLGMLDMAVATALAIEEPRCRRT